MRCMLTLHLHILSSNKLLPLLKIESCIMCHVPCARCHVSCVMCQVSCAMCHVSCVMCHVPMLYVSIAYATGLYVGDAFFDCAIEY